LRRYKARIQDEEETLWASDIQCMCLISKKH
jgi:hypothetical protein